MGRKPTIPFPVKFCPACGKQLERRLSPCGWLESYVMLSNRTYCNNKCQRAYQKAQRGLKASASRMAAHLKAKPSCEKCGKAGRLDVHHIDSNPLNNADDNLKTLCRSCHLYAHRSAVA